MKSTFYGMFHTHAILYYFVTADIKNQPISYIFHNICSDLRRTVDETNTDRTWDRSFIFLYASFAQSCLFGGQAADFCSGFRQFSLHCFRFCSSPICFSQPEAYITLPLHSQKSAGHSFPFPIAEVLPLSPDFCADIRWVPRPLPI